MTKYHPNSIISPINKHLTEEDVTPYHVMAYNIHIDPDENMAIPPTPCPKRDGNMVRIFEFYVPLRNSIAITYWT